MSAYLRLCQLEEETAHLKRLLANLREALALHGKHANDCGRYESDGSCTCGLDVARQL